MNARILPFLLALSVTAASTGLVTAQEANGLRAQGIVEIDTGSVEAQGISHLYDQGFDVFRIIQTSEGSYVFHAAGHPVFFGPHLCLHQYSSSDRFPQSQPLITL